jgi:DNA-binding transcriptional ArsR family regulator
MRVKHAELVPGRNPAKKRTRLPEDAPTYPTNHRIRHEALIILHEGEFSAAEIAEMIGEDTRHVANHLRDLYDAGSIEFVGYKGEGNFKRAVYRAIARPFTDSREYQKMSVDERHEAMGCIFSGIGQRLSRPFVRKRWPVTKTCACYRMTLGLTQRAAAKWTGSSPPAGVATLMSWSS